MHVDAPLNNGQLWSWRDIDRYPRDWLLDANLPVAWDLRGIGLPAALAALRRLTERHETLRTTYHLRTGAPVQRVHPTVPLPIERIERVVSDPDEPDHVKDELARQPFGMTGEVGWRGQLVTTGGAPVYLALSFSHLFFDVWSTHQLREHFRELTADLDAAIPAAPAPRAIAHQQRGPEWQQRRTDAERYWRRLLDDDIGACFPTLPARAQRPRIEAILHSRRLGGLAAMAARRHRVSAPSVVLAMIVAGLARYLDTDRITVSLMASNRFTPEYQRVIGTMNQLIPIVAAVDHRASLAELIKRVHWAGARAYRYSCYDTDRVCAMAAETLTPAGHDCWFNHVFRCWFNYLQLDRVTSDPADPTPAELVWTPLAQPYGQAFRVRVAVANGLTSVMLLADPDILPAETVTGILRGLALGTHLAADDPHGSLRGLWERRGDLDPALFPPDVPTPQTRISAGAG